MRDEKLLIANTCHKLYERGHLVATSGNVSVRTGNRILITPAATRKDTIKPDDIVECDLDGKPFNKSQHPSSEIEMHRASYSARPDINAAIHAHPRFCVACSVVGIQLTEAILPELVVYVGPAPTAPYATPGTREQAEAVKPLLENHNAFLLERHGVLVLGRDLEETLSRFEQLEYVAQIAYLAHAKGPVKPLAKEQIEKLVEKAKKIGQLSSFF
jgi:L-fuculose-phosphate aldolase